jgi:murein DD-endopeptidase MepM/ murein hydrolase activator NlpD
MEPALHGRDCGGGGEMVEAKLIGIMRPILVSTGVSAALWLSGCVAAAPQRATPRRIAHDFRVPERDDEDLSRRFSWPVRGGDISSGFGMRNGVMHDGIDIRAPRGTPVRAADRGVVIFSGRQRGYGNVVIIRHDGHYATVYGHNTLNLVRVGDRVARGEIVATMGRTGDATGSNVHFEVRRDNLARNPLEYLPWRAAPGPSFAAGGGS